jgi:hypothetical protein
MEDCGSFLAFYTVAVQNISSLREFHNNDDEEKEN